MWYNINFNRLSVLLQLTALRKPAAIALKKAFMAPLVTLHYRWWVNRERNFKKIDTTWQVCYMRGSLNDKFDPVLRRIEIDVEGGASERTFIYTPAEDRPKFLGTLYIRTPLEIQGTGADFLVLVPAEILANTPYEVRAEIDFYKLGGKKYLIVEI